MASPAFVRALVHQMCELNSSAYRPLQGLETQQSELSKLCAPFYLGIAPGPRHRDRPGIPVIVLVFDHDAGPDLWRFARPSAQQVGASQAR